MTCTFLNLLILQLGTLQISRPFMDSEVHIRVQKVLSLNHILNRLNHVRTNTFCLQYSCRFFLPCMYLVSYKLKFLIHLLYLSYYTLYSEPFESSPRPFFLSFQDLFPFCPPKYDCFSQLYLSYYYCICHFNTLLTTYSPLPFFCVLFC